MGMCACVCVCTTIFQSSVLFNTKKNSGYILNEHFWHNFKICCHFRMWVAQLYYSTNGIRLTACLPACLPAMGMWWTLFRLFQKLCKFSSIPSICLHMLWPISFPHFLGSNIPVITTTIS